MSAGAAFVVVIGIYAFGVTNLYGYVWFAFAGAFAASVVVFVLGTVGRGGPTPVTLALAGVAVSALLGALTSALVLADSATLDAYRFWAVGTWPAGTPDVVVQVAPVPGRRTAAGGRERARRSTCSASARTSPAASG